MHLWREIPVPQDWASVAAYLASQGMALETEPAPRQYAGGVANLNYGVLLDGTPAVLRRPPMGMLAEGANDLAREFRVMSALHPALPLVPKPLHFCDDASVLGAPFLLIEARDGVAIGSRLPEGADRLTTHVVEVMAAVHALDPEEIGLGDLGKPEGFLARQVSGWGRRAAAVYPDGLPSALTAVLEHLQAQPVPTSEITLLHGDLKPDNVLVDPVSLAPVAVIDWDMGTRGDPLFDLAVLLSYWVDPDDPVSLHAIDQVPSLEQGAPSRKSVARRYAEATGRDVSDLGFHITLARLRLAVAWVQLHRQRAATDPRYADFEKIALNVLTWTADTLSEPPL